MKNGEKTNDYRGALQKNGAISFVPEGTSMWPTIKGGKNTVIIQAIKSPIKPLDVIFYKRGEKNVLHRVMTVLEDGYVTMGDGLFFTEKVKKEDVFGVMAGFYRGKKYISADDESYLAKVERLYKKERTRKVKVNTYLFFVRIKRKIKKIFRKK